MTSLDKFIRFYQDKLDMFVESYHSIMTYLDMFWELTCTFRITLPSDLGINSFESCLGQNRLTVWNLKFHSKYTTHKPSEQVTITVKVIVEKSRGEGSLMEQDTIENAS